MLSAVGGGAARAVDVDEIDAEGEEEQAPAGGVEDVGAGPEFLVDGEGEVPEAAGEEASAAGEGDAAGLLDDGAGGAQPDAGEHADERGGEGGDGAEQAFGIAGALVEVVGEKIWRSSQAVRLMSLSRSGIWWVGTP